MSLLEKMKSLFGKPKLIGVKPEAMARDYPLPDRMANPPFIGKLAVLSYFIPDGLMHPQDAERYLEGNTKGELLFECIAENRSWVTISNNMNESFRVNPNRVLWVPTPEYKLGDDVETANGTHRIGTVVSRVWHFKEKRFYYFIEIWNKQGRRVWHKRRYWAEDLISRVADKDN